MVNELMSKRRQNTVNIHQLLHGYDDGHRLLSGSINPERSSAKTILTFSDLSGQIGELGSNGYLTGYPLPDMNTYAIARTWLAPEMSRPGCVWTQTLLIDFSDLAYLENLSLLNLFRRPVGIIDSPSYNHILAVDTRPQNQDPRQIPLSTIIDLMIALYEYPNASVFAQIHENLPLDEIAFVLWLQQWPKLRRNFRFCTWTASDRSRAGEQFDLQFVPHKSIILGKRSNGREKIWVDLVTPLQSNKLDSFKNWAIQLLPRPETSSLNKFLWRFGAEANSGRADFIPLSIAWEAFEVTPEIDIQSAIDAANSFTPPILGLTKNIIDKIVQSSDNIKIFSGPIVEFLLNNLLLLDDEISVEYVTQIAQIVRHNAANIIWIFFQSDSTLLYSIATSAAQLMTPEEALKGANGDYELFCAALEANPRLANSASVWEAPNPFPSRVAEILKEKAQLKPEILAFMMEADNNEIPSIAIGLFGQKAIDAIFENFDINNTHGLHKLKQWLVAAREHPALILNAMEHGRIKNMRTLALVASYSKYSFPPASIAREEWLHAVTIAEGDLGDYSFQFHVFLLARALSGNSPEPSALLKYSFDPVHDDLLQSKGTQDAWSMLKRELPEVSIYYSWDYAHRLRSGIVQAFVGNDLPPMDFFELTKDDNTFKKLLNIATSSKEGEKYLEKAMNSVQKNLFGRSSNRFTMAKEVIRQKRKWSLF
jgi:hypothetical protein